MLVAIVDGVSERLRDEYPEGAVYFDELPEGFVRPCFLVRCLGVRQVPRLDNLYWREHSLAVVYFPKDGQDGVRERAVVATGLLMALEYIVVDGAQVRGKAMRHEVVDGVMHFFVDYNLFVRKVKERLPYMESLEQHDELKGKEG